MDLREEFVLRAKAPRANVAELCRVYGISRKTGYKWLARFRTGGVEGLRDMSRRPRRVVETSGELVLRVAELRRAHPTWGPKKLRFLLVEQKLEDVPSAKTIGRILERLGEPKLRVSSRVARAVQRTAPTHVVEAPNDLWTVDFKGWWRTQSGEHCEPLTVRDAFSRFVLCCKVMTSTAMAGVRAVFERLFEQYGLPREIHVDNGSPFGSTRARAGLTKLSAWWTALGIRVVFSRPGCPQDNGGHERMHGDLALEVERDAAVSNRAQQRACDRWVQEFNHVRPHEALGMKTPASVYKRSPRPFRGVRPARYRVGFAVRRADSSGHVRVDERALFAGSGFAGYSLGVERVGEAHVRLWFYEVDLGLFDLETAPKLWRSRRSDAPPRRSASSARGSSRATGRARRPASSSRKATPSIARNASRSKGSRATSKRNPIKSSKKERAGKGRKVRQR